MWQMVRKKKVCCRGSGITRVWQKVRNHQRLGRGSGITRVEGDNQKACVGRGSGNIRYEQKKSGSPNAGRGSGSPGSGQRVREVWQRVRIYQGWREESGINRVLTENWESPGVSRRSGITRVWQRVSDGRYCTGKAVLFSVTRPFK